MVKHNTNIFNKENNKHKKSKKNKIKKNKIKKQSYNNKTKTNLNKNNRINVNKYKNSKIHRGGAGNTLKTIEELAENIGLKYIKIKDDGWCYYYAILQGLTDEPENGKTIEDAQNFVKELIKWFEDNQNINKYPFTSKMTVKDFIEDETWTINPETSIGSQKTEKIKFEDFLININKKQKNKIEDPINGFDNPGPLIWADYNVFSQAVSDLKKITIKLYEINNNKILPKVGYPDYEPLNYNILSENIINLLIKGDPQNHFDLLVKETEKIIIRENIPTTNISNYTYALNYFYPNYSENRGLLNITSKNNITNYTKNFNLYKSNSEMGMWRLCFRLWNDQLYKGEYDYVQQSFINIELQKFINLNIDKVKKVGKIDCDDKIKDENLSKINIIEKISENNKYTVNKYNIYNHINDINRKIEIDIFNEYAKLHKCGNAERTSSDNLTKALDILTNNMKNQYSIQGNPEEVYKNYKFTINTDSTINKTEVNLDGNIYRIILKNNKNNNLLYLYYLNYNLKINTIYYTDPIFYSKNQDIMKTNYFIPIMLVPDNSEITEYGTYSKYIVAGNYICKILDYYEQCTIDEKKETICWQTYIFIGERYNKIFPFNILKTKKNLSDPIDNPSLKKVCRMVKL